jgi:hypothetical protein
MAINPNTLGLGRRRPHPPDHPHHRMRLASFLSPTLEAPASVDWTTPVSEWGIDDNDHYGDCTVVSADNTVRVWTANTSTQYSLPIEAILGAYTTLNGFDPGPPVANDNGAVISDMLALWHSEGVGGIGGHVLDGFAEVDHASPYHMQLSVALFGACILGVRLPNAAKQALREGAGWSTPDTLTGDNEPGSWGDHCTPIVKYTPDGAWFVTWGQLQFATWGWVAAYCDEAWAPVSKDWIRSQQGQSPSGLDLAGLLTAMKTIADEDP